MTAESRADGRQASTAEAYLSHLRDRGIDFLYLGSGSDTAPLVEAYARAGSTGRQYPVPVVSAHENVAVGMAHGHYMVSGKPQAVMLHVTVGAANAVCGVMNAARAQVPMLFTAGRTPVYEEGALGSRDSEIQWAQEMFDQAGMLRELVKWDYELRSGLHLTEVVDRALDVAMAHPRGPVYLSLPREALASPAMEPSARKSASAPASPPAPDPDAVMALARALAGAQVPVIMCTASGADPATVNQLVELCDRFGIGVGEARSRYVCFPDDHRLHLGHDPAPIYASADAFLFLESDVPWVPSRSRPAESAFVAQAGTDPLFVRYPMRSHRSGLTITSSVGTLLPALSAALHSLGAEAGAADRAARLTEMANAQRERVKARAAKDAERGGSITKAFLSGCLAKALPAEAIVVNEYPALRERLPLNEPGRYFMHPMSGGLGWGLPAALGARQAAPGRTVVAFLGDGAYLFSNPAACHHAAALHGLPVVTVVFNNGGWAAVQAAAAGIYPTGAARAAAKGDTAVLSSLAPLPDFERYVEASGGLGLRATTRAELPAVLERAFAVSKSESRQVLVNVIGEG